MCSTAKIKKRLYTYIGLKKELMQIDERLKEMESSQDLVKSVVITDMPKGSSTDKDTIGKLIARIESLRDEYNKKLDKMLCELNFIEKLIENLEPTERMLMRKRYIQGMEWREISSEMYFSQETAWRMHRRILIKLSKLTVDDS